MSTDRSYGQVLKATVVMGAATAVNLLMGLIRTKFAAVLVGTVGIGLLSSFSAMQSLIGTLAGLGIQSSGVRVVALAVSNCDEKALGNAVITIRRASWISGLVGMLAMVLLSPQLSLLTFGSDKYTFDIAFLGVGVLFANLYGADMALIQGMRRIGQMALISSIGGVLGSMAAIGCYAMLGLRGIVPGLVAVTAIQLGLSWFYARTVPIPLVSLSWKETFKETIVILKLGIVLTWVGFLSTLVGYMTIVLVNQKIDVQAVSIYSAAFSLSGMFVGHVLSAMGADYYPRLSGLVHDKVAVNKLVNEQTEIGLLLAVPGLLVTMALAPWMIQAFYTTEFMPAVKLMHWFIVGCFGRVLSWPLSYVILALGKGRLYMLTETGVNLTHAGLIALGLWFVGIEGVSIAFFSTYIIYLLAMYIACSFLTSFKWTNECKKIIIYSILILGLTFVISRTLSLGSATFLGLLLALIFCVFSIRGLIARVGPEHRLVRSLSGVPGVKWFSKD